MYRRILVPVDGSATCNKALVAALQMARMGGGSLRLVHVIEAALQFSAYGYAGDLLRVVREEGSKLLEAALEISRSAGVPADTRLVDDPARRLGEVVRDEALAWGADLIVLGTHGRRGLGRVLMGSGAEQIIRQAPVPVLVIRSDAQPPAS